MLQLGYLIFYTFAKLPDYIVKVLFGDVTLYQFKYLVSKPNNFTHFKPGKYEPFYSPLTTFSVLLSNAKTNLLVSEDATRYKGLITFYFSTECFTHPGSCLIFFY